MTQNVEMREIFHYCMWLYYCLPFWEMYFIFIFYFILFYLFFFFVCHCHLGLCIRQTMHIQPSPHDSISGLGLKCITLLPHKTYPSSLLVLLLCSGGVLCSICNAFISTRETAFVSLASCTPIPFLKGIYSFIKKKKKKKGSRFFLEGREKQLSPSFLSPSHLFPH